MASDVAPTDVVWFELDANYVAAIAATVEWLESEGRHEAADKLRPMLDEDQPAPPEGARIVTHAELVAAQEIAGMRASWAAEDAGFDPSGTDLFAEFACVARMPRVRSALPGRSVAVRRRRSNARGKPREPDPPLADRQRQ